MNVSIIGSGNLAWHLAPALDNAGYVVKEVYSRNPKHSEELTGRLYQAEVKATLDFSTVIPPSLSFAALMIRSRILCGKSFCLVMFLVHTSGSQPLSILQFAATNNIGVIYPLQTFTKTKRIDFKNVPVFIESNNEETEKALMQMARLISTQVKKFILKNERPFMWQLSLPPIFRIIC